MYLSRRQFIQASSLAFCTSFLPFKMRMSSAGNLLPVPPLLEYRQGQVLCLTLQNSHWSFNGNKKVPVWGINGLFLGPTVRVWNGDDVKLIYTNRLNESVSMTISGLQVPGALMGGAARMISPGVNWAPVIPIRQAAATCWYHANTPKRMALHVYNGLVGMWIIEDKISNSLPIPNKYGIDDFPLIIQDKQIDNFGILKYDPPEHGSFMGNTLLVNGVQAPYVEVYRGWVRLRLLNASNSRHYQLKISDNLSFNVIASDQGLLPAPITVQQLSLAPGERREVLVDMSNGDEISITAQDTTDFFEKLYSFFGTSSILKSTCILKLRTKKFLSLVTGNLPVRLLADNKIEGIVSCTRKFFITDKFPGINGALWDTYRIDVHTIQGTFERWIIYATQLQAFHIQGVMFLIKNINGRPPREEDSGWKDTVWIDQSAELFVWFIQPSSDRFPFFYYTQTLEMADRGTMGQLSVFPKKIKSIY